MPLTYEQNISRTLHQLEEFLENVTYLNDQRWMKPLFQTEQEIKLQQNIERSKRLLQSAALYKPSFTNECDTVHKNGIIDKGFNSFTTDNNNNTANKKSCALPSMENDSFTINRRMDFNYTKKRHAYDNNITINTKRHKTPADVLQSYNTPPTPTAILLDNELQLFAQYVCLSQNERTARDDVFRQIQQLVTCYFRNYNDKVLCTTSNVSVQLFGSFATPAITTFLSDIDIAISGVVSTTSTDNNISPLQILYRQLLKRTKLARSVTFIRKARVPILKVKTCYAFETDIALHTSTSADTNSFASHQLLFYDR
jgi:predicted nucleotidyltransferase